MRAKNLLRMTAAPLVLMALVSCGSSKAATPKVVVPASTSSSAAATPSSAAAKTTAAGAPTSSKAAGSADCVSLKDALAGMTVNWQVIVGLGRQTDVAQWADVTKTIGTLPKFAAQLDTLTASLGSDADAAASLAFMKGANDIVQKGLGGDKTSGAQLSTYLGTDLTASIQKQTAIAIAASKAHC